MRTTKSGRKIAAEVKSYLVTVKKEVEAGTLDKRGEAGKLFAGVKVNKTVPVGTKVCLRFGIRKFNGNLLVYMHSFGWAEVKDMNEVFTASKEVQEDLFQKDYSKLSAEEKISAIKMFFPEKFSGLTKTEAMLIAHLEGKDLNEVEKEVAADKSLKYKIKKHTSEYETAFLKKLEMNIA